MKTRILTHLMGGLGNQMFQYAIARSLSSKLNAKLYLDNFSGFVLDKIYKRKFELYKFPILGEYGVFWTMTPYWFEKLYSKLFKLTKNNIVNRGVYLKLNEQSLNYDNSILNGNFKNKLLWLHGYWQSEKYFFDIKEKITRELTPPTPTNPVFLNAAKIITESNSVAVGVRLYEEVPANVREEVGGVTQFTFYNEAALKIKCKSPIFFVFCTNMSPQLADLNFPGEIVYITHENGFVGALDRLWLFMQCKNHIISNSSFYWWGAWLSEQIGISKSVIASNKFTNKDSIPDRWIKI